MLETFDGSMPFHLFLKERFRENKNWGSKDRKRYRACCYWFWRNAFGVARNNATEILQWLQINYTEETLNGTSANETSYHPYSNLSKELSLGLTAEMLTPWFTKEPLVWLRATNGKNKAVLQQLHKLNITVENQINDCIAVNAQANLNPITDFGHAYIQDIGSQMAMDWKKLPLNHLCNANHKIWDCCCGAGGKSITLLQNYPKAYIIDSDVRPNILENLEKRFHQLQLQKPNTQLIDLENTVAVAEQYDIVLADVPCSGSGTWRRNPENIHFFSSMEISLYANKQQLILTNVQTAVKLGGYIVYMTCSIFSAENENNVTEFLEKHSGFKKIEEEFFGGISENGDYIYRAILQRVS